MAHTSTKPQKRALLIGIDAYREAEWNSLAGCKNDALKFRETLVNYYEFPATGCRLLLDEAATQQGIRQAMAELAAQVEPNSLVVFFFAGHGLSIDASDERSPTADMQCIVPHDSTKSSAVLRAITDSELRAWVRELGRITPYVTLIFDCCHSGTMTRSLESGVRRIPAQRRATAQPPQEAVRREKPAERGKGWLALELFPCADRYVALSACRDEELAGELQIEEAGSRRSHGVFTHHLITALREKSMTGRSYRDLMDLVALQVARRNNVQHPRAEGALDRRILGIDDMDSTAFVNVQSISESEVILQAGAVHCVTLGTEWVLSPLSGDDDSVKRQVRVRVTEVWATLSRAVIVHESAASACLSEADRRSLQLPCRAERAGAAGDPHRWPIRAAPEGRLAGLRETIERSPWLRWADVAEEPEVTIVSMPAPSKAAASASMSALVALPRPVLVALDRAQRPILPPVSLQDGAESAEVLARMLEELELLVRCRWLSRLNNPGSKMESAIQLKLLLAPHFNVAPVDELGRLVVSDGSFAFLELRNISQQPVYATVIVISSDRRITQIYPPPGAPSQRIDPQHGIRPGAWQLRLPHPQLLPPGAHDCGSSDVMKLFVTEEEVNFHSLLCPTETQRAPVAPPAIFRQIAEALTGTQTRGAASSPGPGEWACLSFEVHITPAVR